MATTTVGAIKTRARQKADMVGSNFISEPEMLNYVNESYSNYYDLIVSRFEDYNVSDPTPFTISSGTPYYSLPADFYKCVGVDRSIDGGSRYFPLKPYQWRHRDRNIGRFTRYGMYPRISYRIVGTKLKFIPEDDSPGDYRIWYVPLATVFTDDADTIERYNGFEELVVIDTAIKMLAKEESDIQYLMIERQRIELRIKEMAQLRDAAEADVIEDAFDDDYDYDSGYY